MSGMPCWGWKIENRWVTQWTIPENFIQKCQVVGIQNDGKILDLQNARKKSVLIPLINQTKMSGMPYWG